MPRNNVSVIEKISFNERHNSIFTQEAKSNGCSITVETCPHYLAFSAEEIKDGDTRFKCAPPIRDSANKEKLWEALMVLGCSWIHEYILRFLFLV